MVKPARESVLIEVAERTHHGLVAKQRHIFTSLTSFEEHPI